MVAWHRFKSCYNVIVIIINNDYYFPIIATPRVPSATPSPGLYATPTVTATSSPTDPTTTAGAPFSLAPIVAPVVAITILLLLAAVLVIALVLGWKYGRSERIKGVFCSVVVYDAIAYS